MATTSCAAAADPTCWTAGRAATGSRSATADELIGGPDSDSLDSPNIVSEAIPLSLDDVANDGLGGPGTGNVHGDVEEMRARPGRRRRHGLAGPGDDPRRRRKRHDRRRAAGTTSSTARTATTRSRRATGLASASTAARATTRRSLDDVDASLDCETPQRLRPGASRRRTPTARASPATATTTTRRSGRARPSARERRRRGLRRRRRGRARPRRRRRPAPAGLRRHAHGRAPGRAGGARQRGRRELQRPQGAVPQARASRCSQRTLAFATFTLVDRLRLGRCAAASGCGSSCTRRRLPVQVPPPEGQAEGQAEHRPAAARPAAARRREADDPRPARNGVAKQFAFTFRRGAAPIFLIRCAAPGAGLRRC